MPICEMCGQEKEDSKFPKKSKIHCKPCKHKKYYDAVSQKERYLLSKLDPENSPNAKRKKNPARWLYHQAKARAKARELPFNITIEDIVVPEYCPVFGFKLVMNEIGAKHDSISLDRIIPELGYTKGNVRVISWLANAMKSNATEDLLITFAEWVLANHKRTN